MANYDAALVALKALLADDNAGIVDTVDVPASSGAWTQRGRVCE